MILELHVVDSTGTRRSVSDSGATLIHGAFRLLAQAQAPEQFSSAATESKIWLSHNNRQTQQHFVSTKHGVTTWSFAKPTVLHSGEYVAVAVDEQGEEVRSASLWLVVRAAMAAESGPERVLDALVPAIGPWPRFQFDAATGVLRLYESCIDIVTAERVKDHRRHLVYVFDRHAHHVHALPLLHIDALLHDVIARQRANNVAEERQAELGAHSKWSSKVSLENSLHHSCFPKKMSVTSIDEFKPRFFHSLTGAMTTIPALVFVPPAFGHQPWSRLRKTAALGTCAVVPIALSQWMSGDSGHCTPRYQMEISATATLCTAVGVAVRDVVASTSGENEHAGIRGFVAGLLASTLVWQSAVRARKAWRIAQARSAACRVLALDETTRDSFLARTRRTTLLQLLADTNDESGVATEWQTTLHAACSVLEQINLA